MLPFRGENRGVKRKNDYYYIIKLDIFQRKSEETTPSFPKRNTSPRGDAAIRKCYTNTVAFVQLTKDALGLLTKKKKVL